MADSSDSPDSKAQPGTSPGGRFPCAHCHAEQTFDVVRGLLRCEYCGTMREVPPGPTPAHPGERSLADGLRAAAQPGAATTTTRELRCAECGAEVAPGTSEMVRTCTFCGTASVAPGPAHQRGLLPDSVLPFCIDKRTATKAFSRWLQRLWLRPTALRHLATLDQLHGVYVPFWIFGARVESQWSAETGRYYYVADDQLTILGKSRARPPNPDDDGSSGTLGDAHSPGSAERDDDAPGVLGGPTLPSRGAQRRVRQTRWRATAGQRTDVHQDVLVCASQGLKGGLAERLGSYNLRRLVPYADGYLAGFAAEAYAVPLDAGHTLARRRLDATQQELCARDVGGDTHKNLIVRNRYSDETFRYALLPVWIATYRYHAQVYRFVVSGQTGEVLGQAPYSRLKVALTCLLGLALLVLSFYLWNRPADLDWRWLVPGR